MKFFNQLPLKTKILALLTGISLTFLLVGFSLQQYMVHAWQDNEVESFQQNVKSFGAAVAAQFYERYGDIQAIASNGTLLSRDAEKRKNALNSYISLYGIYDLFLLVDTKGNLVSANDRDPSGKQIETHKLAGKNFSDQDWFQNAMAGKFTEDKNSGFSGTYVTDPSIDPITSEIYGQSMYGNSFTTTLKDQKGNVIGVISARAGFRWVEYDAELLYRKLLAENHFGAEVILVNKNGEKILDINPTTFSEKNGYQRNIAAMGKEKTNYYSEKLNKDIEAGNASVHLDHNSKNGETDVVSYGPVKDAKKFISSMGWKTIIASDEDGIGKTAVHARNIFLGVFLFLGTIALFVGYIFSHGLSLRIKKMADLIANDAESVTSTSKKVADASTSLASSTQEQAAAVQETVAAIDEISAMVTKSADNAKDSQAVAEASEGASKKGKEAIDAMLLSMDEIHKSNGTIMTQIDSSNQELTSIVKLINEIGQKTKVINDIVFQTKLLSFNASVEAARAGEHGKGFAIVAEEVGNLAQLSGNAAKEITEMLEGSIHKVEQIVNNTKERVSGLMEENRQKVNSGSENAKRCAEMLSEIVENVTKMGQMSLEIAVASKEQNQGVMEITKAMNQLGIHSQENANSSQESSTASKELLGRADELKKVVVLLTDEVMGSTKKTAAEIQPPTSTPKQRPLEKKNSEKPLPSNVVKIRPEKTAAKQRELKVVGGASIPTSDDPRFEEV